MKRKIVWASVLGLTLCLGTAGRASADPSPDQTDKPAHHRMSPEEHLNKLAERLKLNDDQKKTVGEAMKERGDKMKALHEDSMAKAKVIMEDSDKKIEAVLNADQKAEYAKMKDEMQKRREEFRERMNKDGKGAWRHPDDKDHDGDAPDHP